VKKLLPLAWLILILGILALLQLGCEKKAEEKKPYQIRTKTAEKMTICYLEHLGPYDQMGDLFAQLGGYAAEKGLTGDVVGIYYDDPAEVPAASLRSEIGVGVTEGFVADSVRRTGTSRTESGLCHIERAVCGNS
jgi:DNA gyrase inhibitor GyrI